MESPRKFGKMVLSRRDVNGATTGPLRGKKKPTKKTTNNINEKCESGEGGSFGAQAERNKPMNEFHWREWVTPRAGQTNRSGYSSSASLLQLSKTGAKKKKQAFNERGETEYFENPHPKKRRSTGGSNTGHSDVRLGLRTYPRWGGGGGSLMWEDFGLAFVGVWELCWGWFCWVVGGSKCILKNAERFRIWAQSTRTRDG